MENVELDNVSCLLLVGELFELENVKYLGTRTRRGAGRGRGREDALGEDDQEKYIPVNFANNG